MDFSFRIFDEQVFRLLKISGSFTLGHVTEVRQTVESQLATGRRVLCIDLSAATVVDSKGLAFFADMHRLLSDSGGRLYFVAVPPRIMRLLQTCGLDRKVAFFATSAEAAANLKSNLRMEDRGFFCVIALKGNINVEQVKPMRDTIDAGLRKGHSRIVFDCGEVSSISSVGIGVLANLQKTLLQKGGSVYLVRLQPQVAEVLRATNMLQIIPNFPDLQQVEEKLIL